MRMGQTNRLTDIPITMPLENGHRNSYKLATLLVSITEQAHKLTRLEKQHEVATITNHSSLAQL